MNTQQDIIEKINQLKAQRKAVILAHNYQPGPVQDIADITGDSLGLSELLAFGIGVAVVVGFVRQDGSIGR